MAKLKRRSDTKEIAEQVENSQGGGLRKREAHWDKVISTGSTLLDLNISGNRVRGGGIPGGVLVEIFGPPKTGKTALLSELCISTQRRGGKVYFQDPEARYDLAYARNYGVAVDDKKKWEYGIPETVKELFVNIREWKPPNPKTINMVAGDSLASLTTELEIESDETTMKTNTSRSVEFSNELRKTCRLIERSGMVIACANQIRKFKDGEYVPGGHSMAFYASLRIRIGPYPRDKYMETKAKVEFEGQEIKDKKRIGVRSKCFIKHSSIDDPFRECEVFIEFGRGIDDVRANLRYLKEKTKANTYDCIEREYQSLEKAVYFIEKNGLALPLREKVIDLWETIEAGFGQRPPKERF